MERLGEITEALLERLRHQEPWFLQETEWAQIAHIRKPLPDASFKDVHEVRDNVVFALFEDDEDEVAS